MVDYKGDKAIQTSWLFECFVEGKENFKKVEDAHFFTKSHEWGYEEEWRAISWRSKGTFRSPKADLIGVYLGYRCPPEVCVTIARLFRGVNNAPKFYRMKPCSPKGDLKAEPLAIEALMVENFECGLYQKYQSRLLDGFSAD